MFKVAIVGQTNVGKSTLYNRLLGNREALTFARAGVTRDVRESVAEIYDKKCIIADTPGFFEENELLKDIIKAKIIETIADSQIVIFVIDGEVGLTENDKEIADIIRKSNKRNVIVALNKSEKKSTEHTFIDALSMGFLYNIRISAEHGNNINELISSLYDMLPEEEVEFFEDKNKTIKLAIIGRPNVGKSTIINKILGKDTRIVADMPGVTRESASFDFFVDGRRISIIDTPGIRKKSNIDDNLEKISVINAKKACKEADAVILIIDASSLEGGEIEKQDIKLASYVVSLGKAFIIAFNKVDLTPYKREAEPLKFLRRNIAKSLSQLKNVPFLLVCGTDGYNINCMIEMAISTLDKQAIKLKTSELNEWLISINNSEVIPVKLKYITQIGTVPPKFVIFTNKAEKIIESKKRYVINRLRENFNLNEVPIRVFFKNS